MDTEFRKLVDAGLIPASLLTLGDALAEHFTEHSGDYPIDTSLDLTVRFTFDHKVNVELRIETPLAQMELMLDYKGEWHGAYGAYNYPGVY